MIRTNRAPSTTPTGIRPPGIDGLLAVAPTRSRLPAVVRNVRHITQVVLDPMARIQALSETLSADPALCTEMLRLSNSAFAGSTQRRVDTVHQAVLLLGFDRMRDVAVGAAVFSMLETDDKESTEGAAASVLTAHHALAIASELRHPRPETAYLAGLLRNLGDMACAQWLPVAYGAYREALKAGASPRVAARTHLGATTEEMGRALSLHWQLPDPIRDSLAPSMGAPLDGPDAQLPEIAKIAARITDAVYRLPPPAEAAWGSVFEAAERLGLSPDTLRTLANWAYGESVEMLASLRPGLDMDDWREKLEAAVTTALTEDSFARMGEQATSGGLRTTTSLSVAELQAEAAREAEEATDDAINVALMTLLGSGYQRCALLLPDATSGTLRVRYADGEGAEFLPQRIEVGLDGRSTLSAAFRAAKDLIFADRVAISQANDSAMKHLRAVTAAWLPVCVSGIVIGAIYADTLRSLPTAPEVETAQVARDRLGATLTAIRERGRALAA